MCSKGDPDSTRRAPNTTRITFAYANIINDCMYVPIDITALLHDEIRNTGKLDTILKLLWKGKNCMIAYIYKGIPIQIGSI